MPKVSLTNPTIPFIIVGGLPRSGKSGFISRLSKVIPNLQVFKEETYVRGANPFNVNFNPERNREPYCNREYALNYHENAEFLLREAMLKDVVEAAYNRQPVVMESNFFCMPKYRKLFRSEALTQDHLPVYVSIYIGDRRAGNKPLDKYLESDNTMFENGNRRPRIQEGFISMSAREVIDQYRC